MASATHHLKMTRSCAHVVKEKLPFLVLALLLVVGGLGGNSGAQIVVDGTLNNSEGYGNPLAAQTINTGFGDNHSDAGGGSSGGSELDAVYGVVTNGYL